MNQGYVDKDGHWHPIFSTGYDGIDQNTWYRNKIDALKADLGYDSRTAKSQHDEEQNKAIVSVFGKKWYMLKDSCFDDPRVKKLMEKEEARYAEFVRRRDEYRLERTHRLDQMFMDVVEKRQEREWFCEIGSLDSDKIKETCKILCSKYEKNVGMMTNCLDFLLKNGYDVWCTCTDCGEQFQLCDYESFGQMMDRESYRGDGGIGVIMGRVLCEECHEIAECPVCYDLDRPNRRAKDKGEADWKNYDFLYCVLNAWIDVCWGCASGYEYDYLYKWNEEDRHRYRTELGKKYETFENEMKEAYGEDGHTLYEEVVKTISGRKTINKIRDLLQDTVEEKFGSSIGDEWFSDRLDTDSPGQMKLPGI